MSGWRTIESAPKDGSWILLTGGEIYYGWDPPDEDDDKPPMVVAQWVKDGEGWQFAWYDSGYYGEYENPTHWAPLPDLPR